MALEICVRCGRGRRAGEWACPSCSSDAYGSRLETDDGPVCEDAEEPTCGLLEGLVSLPPGAVGLISGPKGIGKSTIAFQGLPNPWIITSEMSPQRVRAYLRRLGVRCAGVSQPSVSRDELDQLVVELDLPEPVPRNLVLDSLTGTGYPLEVLAALQATCEEHGARALVIAQVTSEGEARGGPQVVHRPDVVMRLEVLEGVRQIVVEKNRFGPEGERSYQLGPDGARPPARGSYYTIEGSAPRFKLVQHPHPSARYGALYRAIERANSKDAPVPVSLRLPPPPLATAALESTLYAAGFVEPDDIAARRQFAEANGIPYFYPRQRAG